MKRICGESVLASTAETRPMRNPSLRKIRLISSNLIGRSITQLPVPESGDDFVLPFSESADGLRRKLVRDARVYCSRPCPRFQQKCTPRAEVLLHVNPV